MSTHGKTRFVCRIVRLRDAMTGSRAAGHVAHCADCQAYYRSAGTLVDQLRTAAPHQFQAAPDDLAQRIARSVRQSTPAPRRSRVPSAFTALAGAAAVFALAFFLVRPHTSPTQTANNNQQTVPALSKADVTEIVADVQSLRTRLIDSVEPTAEAIATKNPLTQEITSVQTDARKALDFLALNFLPSDSARQLKTTVNPTSS
jgi:hypothetical protein